MSRTYKAIGINLKAAPLGEADRILTILTKEFGLIRAVAMGARKQNSKMSGRSGLFVVNEMLLAKGKSIDKITQAETHESYPGLSRNLKKLTAGQYLAELVLSQALSEQSQEDLFYLLNEHLSRIERSQDQEVLPRLIHAIFQLLAIAGVAPQVHQCCVTGERLEPNIQDPNWTAGFSAIAGGTVTLESLATLQTQPNPSRVESPTGEYRVAIAEPKPRGNPSKLNLFVNAAELTILQHLAQAELPNFPSQSALWLPLERLLRSYAQYHLDQTIRSASLIETCFPL